MSKPKVFHSKHKIAVIGLYRSGKTAFLTSFINHVRNHRPDELKLGDGNVQLTFDKEITHTNGFERFPYEEFRCDNNSQWPRKTKACYQYTCRFFRSDWHYTNGELTLVDIPGERLADIAMADKSYEAWSDWLFDTVFQDKQYRNESRDYLALITDTPATDDSAIIRAYQCLLANLYRSYRPVISPSTFLLGEDGTFTGTKVANDDLSNSYTGLNAANQFAPLPRQVRKQFPAITKVFKQRYDEYRRKIATPLVKMLKGCNELAILIDVTTLLAANTGMYNGNRTLLKQLMAAVEPGQSHFLSAASKVRGALFGGHWRQRGITRIAVLATKADKVHRIHRHNLAALVEQMTKDFMTRLVHTKARIEIEYFACAAVKSTDSLENEMLQGRLPERPAQVSSYVASQVPNCWPSQWQSGEYVFPDVNPVFPENDAIPPAHLGLDKVIEFLLQP